MTADLLPGARIFATDAYTLRTLTLRDDAFVAVTGGLKRLHRPGSTLDIGAGQGVAIARGTQWDVTNDPRGRGVYQALALAFPASLLREWQETESAADVPVVRAAGVLPLDEELREALQRTLPPAVARPLGGRLLRHRVMEVLLLLAQRGYRFAPPDEIGWPDRVRRLVAQRPHADWDVPVLAAAFHLSESTLRRRLDGSGVTLAALVREVRLETALGLLQTSRMPVGEVAQYCGWQSHSRFSAAFQERWGVAPSVVRANLKDEAQGLTESG